MISFECQFGFIRFSWRKLFMRRGGGKLIPLSRQWMTLLRSKSTHTLHSHILVVMLYLYYGDEPIIAIIIVKANGLCHAHAHSASTRARIDYNFRQTNVRSQ